MKCELSLTLSFFSFNLESRNWRWKSDDADDEKIEPRQRVYVQKGTLEVSDVERASENKFAFFCYQISNALNTNARKMEVKHEKN